MMVSHSENQIKRLRLKAGYRTVKEAADLLGVSESHLYKIEQGKAVPGIRLAVKMVKLYKCNLNDIYTFFFEL
jgi:DNA-binding XRE family transcriptional regulator